MPDIPIPGIGYLSLKRYCDGKRKIDNITKNKEELLFFC